MKAVKLIKNVKSYCATEKFFFHIFHLSFLRINRVCFSSLSCVLCVHILHSMEIFNFFFSSCSILCLWLLLLLTCWLNLQLNGFHTLLLAQHKRAAESIFIKKKVKKNFFFHQKFQFGFSLVLHSKSTNWKYKQLRDQNELYGERKEIRRFSLEKWKTNLKEFFSTFRDA